MSWSAEWMRDWLNKGNRTQNELASLSNSYPGSVSRWLSGQTYPNREAVTALVESLDDADAAEFLIAWLKDNLPDNGRRLINIRPAGKTQPSVLREEYKANTKASFPPGISNELREQLVFFSKLAIENPDVRKIVEICYQAATRQQNPPETT
jgi:hypothetical protein